MNTVQDKPRDTKAQLEAQIAADKDKLARPALAAQANPPETPESRPSISGKHVQEAPVVKPLNSIVNDQDLLPGKFWFQHSCGHLQQHHAWRDPEKRAAQIEAVKTTGLCSLCCGMR